MDGSTGNPIMYFSEDGSGPHEHVCANGGPVDRVREWVFRQKLLGLSEQSARDVERLADDLERGEA